MPVARVKEVLSPVVSGRTPGWSLIEQEHQRHPAVLMGRVHVGARFHRVSTHHEKALVIILSNTSSGSVSTTPKPFLFTRITAVTRSSTTRGLPRQFFRDQTPWVQTLIVRSQEPETIVFPSGSKATDLTARLCASSFVALRSSVPADTAGEDRKRQFGSEKAIFFSRQRTGIPDFDRVAASID